MFREMGDVWFGIMVLISPFFKVFGKGARGNPFSQKRDSPAIKAKILHTEMIGSCDHVVLDLR